jgi:hypothetical protein
VGEAHSVFACDDNAHFVRFQRIGVLGAPDSRGTAGEYSLLAAGRRARRGGLALTFSVCAIAARLSGSHDASASIASALIDAHRDALHAGNADGGREQA